MAGEDVWVRKEREGCWDAGNKERFRDQDGAKGKPISCLDTRTPRFSFALTTGYKKLKRLEVWPLLPSPTQEDTVVK